MRVENHQSLPPKKVKTSKFLLLAIEASFFGISIFLLSTVSRRCFVFDFQGTALAVCIDNVCYYCVWLCFLDVVKDFGPEMLYVHIR
jgi:hypothetical protein